MLIFDFYEIGNKLLHARKRMGLTQVEVAEAAGLSDRTYADIERGNVNMRIETVLRICDVLRITPNEIFTKENLIEVSQQSDILERLNQCKPKDRETALKLLSVFLSSLE